MSFFAGLNAEKYDRQYTDRQLLARIAEYFRPQGRRLLGVLGLVILLAAIGASLPLVVAWAVDIIRQAPSLPSIALVGAALAGVGVGTWGLNWVRRALVVRAVGDVVLALRAKAFGAAAEHDLSFYDQFSSGRIVSRITSDSNDFGQLVVIVTDVGAQLVTALILGVVMWRTEWHMALLMYAFVPFMFLLTAAFRSLARAVTRNGMRAMAEVNSAIKETVSGIAVAKNFRQEHSIFQIFDAANQQSYRVNVRRGLVLALVFPTLNAVSGIFTAFLVYSGGLNIRQGLITAGACTCSS